MTVRYAKAQLRSEQNPREPIRERRIDYISIHLDIWWYYEDMIKTDVTPLFRALGDPTRKRIFEFLCAKDCPVAVEESGDVHQIQGVSVGDVCCHVTGSDKFSSTISFHIKELRIAGLINAEKNGKFMICSVRREAIAEMSEYLLSLPSPTTDACR